MQVSSTSLEPAAVAPVIGRSGVVYDDDYVAEEHRRHMTGRMTFLIAWARQRDLQQTGVSDEILDQAEGLVGAEYWEQVEHLLEPVEEAYSNWMAADIRRTRPLRAAAIADYRVEYARRWGFARTARPTRPGRTSVANRARRSVRTAAPTRGDPDDPDPEPAWQDLDEWLSERKQALDALTGNGQPRFDAEVGS